MFFYYKSPDDKFVQSLSIIVRNGDGFTVLNDNDPEYLAWLADGNTPEPLNPEATD